MNKVKLVSKCILGLKSFSKCNCTKWQFVLIPVGLDYAINNLYSEFKMMGSNKVKMTYICIQSPHAPAKDPQPCDLGKSLQPSILPPIPYVLDCPPSCLPLSYCRPLCSQVLTGEQPQAAGWLWQGEFGRWVVTPESSGGENHARWGLWKSLEKTAHAFPES